jgi:tripartite-type tricarboxylate transporter receptor subunit TctC
LTHVPYPGVAPAINATVSGAVTMFCGPIQQGMVHVNAGKLYALGVTSATRSPLSPDVAAVSDIYPGLIISVWVALFAPAGTPASVTQFLHDELNEVYADRELQQRLAVLGLEPEWTSGVELSQRIKNDTGKWTEFMKAANIKAE